MNDSKIVLKNEQDSSQQDSFFPNTQILRNLLLLLIADICSTTELSIEVELDVDLTLLPQPLRLLLIDGLNLTALDVPIYLLHLRVSELLDEASTESSLREVELDRCRVIGAAELLEVAGGMRVPIPFLLLNKDVLGCHSFSLFIYNSEQSRLSI